MAGLSKKDQQRVLKHVEAQGVQITHTGKGYLMRMPDGKTAMMHKSESDHKAPMALRAVLRRSGISWPFDGAKAEMPKYITEGSIRASTLAKYRTVLADKDGILPDEVFPQEVLRQLHEHDHPGEPLPKYPPFTQCYRVLYRLGYQTGGRYGTKNQGKSWVLKQEVVVPEPVKQVKPVAPKEMFAPEPEPVAESVTPEVNTNQPVEPEVSAAERTKETREFLDTHESWTLDVEPVKDLSLDTLVRMMAATGLEVEIRVWKKAA